MRHVAAAWRHRVEGEEPQRTETAAADLYRVEWQARIDVCVDVAQPGGHDDRHPVEVGVSGLLAERGMALGSDGNNDTAPSSTAGIEFPIHVLAINAMGMHLLDYLRFEELVPRCVEADRWSFLCVIAPLRLPSATGSPVNPIAIL